MIPYVVGFAIGSILALITIIMYLEDAKRFNPELVGAHDRRWWLLGLVAAPYVVALAYWIRFVRPR